LLPVEESLGQSGNKRNLDDQSHQRFKSSKHCERIIERYVVAWKETPIMEARHAKHKSSQWGERWSNGVPEKVVGGGKS